MRRRKSSRFIPRRREIPGRAEAWSTRRTVCGLPNTAQMPSRCSIEGRGQIESALLGQDLLNIGAGQVQRFELGPITCESQFPRRDLMAGGATELLKPGGLLFFLRRAIH